MKSNVCKIDNGTRDLDVILKESEKVAVYNELTHKEALQLRLLCEEMDGMLPNVLGDFDGDFWIEFEGRECKVIASINFESFTAEKKAEIVNLSKNKKNAAVVGIVGKIRSVIENFFLDDEVMQAFAISSGTLSTADGCAYFDYAYTWSLEQYKNFVKEEEPREAWDELEKSVIASVADDVIVGVKGKQADIIIVKKFA